MQKLIIVIMHDKLSIAIYLLADNFGLYRYRYIGIGFDHNIVIDIGVDRNIGIGHKKISALVIG